MKGLKTATPTARLRLPEMCVLLSVSVQPLGNLRRSTDPFNLHTEPAGLFDQATLQFQESGSLQIEIDDAWRAQHTALLLGVTPRLATYNTGDDAPAPALNTTHRSSRSARDPLRPRLKLAGKECESFGCISVDFHRSIDRCGRAVACAPARHIAIVDGGRCA